MGKLKEFNLIVMKQGKSKLIDALSPNKKGTLVINLSYDLFLFAISDITQARYGEDEDDSIERMLSDLQEVHGSMRFNNYIFYTDWNFLNEQELVNDILEILGGSNCTFMVNGL